MIITNYKASNCKKFINKIAPIIQKYAKEYGYKLASPVIAQACLESGYGTSNKSKHHNYFGLKYRPNRCPSSSETFVDDSQEQLANGQMVPITDQWFEFATMEDGVKGYFEFISISNYDKLRNNIISPKKYLETLIECKYATAHTYVISTMNIINTFDLTKFDKLDNIKEDKKEEKNIKPVKEENKKETELKEGDIIKLSSKATYVDGKKIPNWVKKCTLYYRGINKNGIIFSTKKTGAITGVVDKKYVIK